MANNTLVKTYTINFLLSDGTQMATDVNIPLPIVVQKVNGSNNPTEIYAPETSGTNGQLLISQGSQQRPVWKSSGANGQLLMSQGSNKFPIWQPFGNVGQMLISQGQNQAPIWGPTLRYIRDSQSITGWIITQGATRYRSYPIKSGSTYLVTPIVIDNAGRYQGHGTIINPQTYNDNNNSFLSLSFQVIQLDNNITFQAFYNTMDGYYEYPSTYINGQLYLACPEYVDAAKTKAASLQIIEISN